MLPPPMARDAADHEAYEEEAKAREEWVRLHAESSTPEGRAAWKEAGERLDAAYQKAKARRQERAAVMAEWKAMTPVQQKAVWESLMGPPDRKGRRERRPDAVGER